jgi:hypothetical protein
LQKLLDPDASLITITQVGGHNDSATDLFFHTQSAPLAAAFTHAGGATRATSPTLPPGPASSFPGAIHSAVLAGFDSQFSSRFWGGERDANFTENALKVAAIVLFPAFSRNSFFHDFGRHFSVSALFPAISNFPRFSALFWFSAFFPAIPVFRVLCRNCFGFPRFPVTFVSAFSLAAILVFRNFFLCGPRN